MTRKLNTPPLSSPRSPHIEFHPHPSPSLNKCHTMLISPKYNRAGLLSIWNEYSDTEIPTLDDIDRVSPFTCWHYHDIPEPTWWNEVYLLRKGTRVIGECIVYCVLWSLCSCGWYFGCVISSCKRMKWWHSVHLGCRPRSSCSFNTIQFKILRSTRGTLYTISFHSTKSPRIKPVSHHRVSTLPLRQFVSTPYILRNSPFKFHALSSTIECIIHERDWKHLHPITIYPWSSWYLLAYTLNSLSSSIHHTISSLL